MDQPDMLSMLAGIITKGGPVAMMVAIWVAYKAGGTAKEAVKALTDLRDAVVKLAPAVDHIAQKVDVIENELESISELSNSANMKMSALLARPV